MAGSRARLAAAAARLAAAAGPTAGGLAASGAAHGVRDRR